jgi:hypothetical protein
MKPDKELVGYPQELAPLVEAEPDHIILLGRPGGVFLLVAEIDRGTVALDLKAVRSAQDRVASECFLEVGGHCLGHGLGA